VIPARRFNANSQKELRRGIMNRNCRQRWAGLSAVLLLGALALPSSAESNYTVRKGDSIWRIAESLNVSCRALLEINNLVPDSVIRPGQELRVPDAQNECPTAAPERRHKVAAGESLWQIARRYGVSVAALVAANDIPNPNLIHPGIELIVPAANASEINAAGGGRQDLVATALKYRGVPYRYAGMSTRGMDCSGLVARVLRSHGVEAPHNSKALYKLGKPVPREQLQPGDLVFFHTTRPGISHVGIYIGDGKFIHASSRSGEVKLGRLDEGYYYRRFVGAKRVD
jgi:cell wall-associated NlpC family hydrolase